MKAPCNLSPQIKRDFQPETVRLLETIGTEGATLGTSIYLVGGAVRDLFRGSAVRDLDLVSETNGMKLAGSLAKAINAEVTAHSTFGTAQMVTPDLKFDIATARRETYKRPGALPTVEPGSIQDDLARRDFSVNAMALHLHPDHFGDITDPFHGQNDLKLKRLRTLHPRSFIDDPTRILRAIRYEERLGIHMDTKTATLAQDHSHYLDAVSGDRIRREIDNMFQEPLPESCLSRAQELGVLTTISPGLHWDMSITKNLSKIRDSRIQIDPLYFLAFLCLRMDSWHATAFCDRVNAPSEWRHVITGAVAVLSKISELSKPNLKDSKVDQLLRGIDETAINAFSLLQLERPAGLRLKLYTESLRNIRPNLDGHDLINLGSQVPIDRKSLLDGLRDAILDGVIQGRDEEIRWVREQLQARRER
jgi:tRNA nucleotidyltransferase (CCA-adding enzyme)